MKERSVFAVWCISLVLLLLWLTVPYQLGITGAVTSLPDEEKIWDFTSLEYTYDTAIILNGTASLKPTISPQINVTAIPLSAATLSKKNNDQNVFDRLDSVSQGLVVLKKEEVLQISFVQQLVAGDVLSFYVLNGGIGTLAICQDASGCSSYGSLNPVSADSWINITLAQTTTVVYLTTDDTAKLDMIVGYHPQQTERIIYPSSGTLETNDFILDRVAAWHDFTAQNSGSVQYQYSVDSGSTWNPLAADFNPHSSKLKIKAVLTSDGSSTPVIEWMKVQYALACVENWVKTYGDCATNDSKVKYYVDNNSCGTADTLPVDNGTVESCDYCTPNWSAANGSCTPGNTFMGRFEDANGCFTQTGLASDAQEAVTYSCNYCDLYNCTDSLQVSFSTDNSSLSLITKTRSLIQGRSPLANGTLTLIETAVSTLTPFPGLPVRRFLEINSSSNFSSVQITLQYNESSGVDEQTLQIYVYGDGWEPLNTTLNESDNEATAIAPHLSWFGLFGTAVQPAPSTNTPSSDSVSGGGSGDGGGGRGGSSRDLSDITIAETAASEHPLASGTKQAIALKGEKTVQESSTTAQKECDYALEMALPEEITISDNDTFESEVISTGNCQAERLALQLSPPLAAIITIPETLEFTGNRTTFRLIRKQSKDTLTGFLTTKPKGAVRGEVLVQGLVQGEVVFSESLPLAITLEKKAASAKMIALVGITALLGVFCIAVYWFGRRRNNYKSRPTILKMR